MTATTHKPARPPAHPLDLTIQNIQLTGFGPVNPQPGGTPPIAHYNGIPFFCHVSEAGSGMYSLVVNRHGPSTFPAGSGPLQSVTVTFGTTGPAAQTMSFAPTNATYGGRPIDAWLKITSPGNATLVLNERAGGVQTTVPANGVKSGARPVKKTDDASGNVPTIVTITVAAAENGTGNDLVFFTDIELPDAKVNDGDVWTASISWANNPGGAMGPIGNAQSP